MVARKRAWLPETGCVPCPIPTATRRAWTGINPFPGFVQPDGGYFSYPLSSWYLPIRSLSEIPERFDPALDIPSMLAGEIPVEQIAAFTAIIGHEGEGHGSLTAMQNKRLLRHIAASAYEILFIMMAEGADLEWWPLLQEHNSEIAELTIDFALVDEALATLLGVHIIRDERKFYHVPGAADAIEDESVAIQSKSERFGQDFELVYRKMSEVHSKVGGYPLKALVTYSQDPLDVDVSTMEDGRIMVESTRFADETGISRVLRGLDVLRAAPYSAAEYKTWSPEVWNETLALSLPGFSTWFQLRQKVEQSLEKATKHHVEWWRKRDFTYFNPALGGDYAASQRCMDVFIITSPTTFVSNRDQFADQSLIDEVVAELVRRHSDARDRGNALIVVSRRPEASGGLAVALQEYDEANTVPYLHLEVGGSQEWLGAEDFPDYAVQTRSILSQNRLQALMQNYGGLQALALFEGLRTMIAAREGIRCPLKNMRTNKRTLERAESATGLNLVPESSECCGAVEWLMTLWHLGKRAEEELGIEFKRWDPPIECLQCAAGDSAMHDTVK